MEIAWNQVTQQVLYTQITRQIFRQNFSQTPSQACIILKARGEKNNAIPVINPIYFSVCSQRRISAWSLLCVRSALKCVRLVHVLMSACVRVKATCLRKQRNGIGSIQPSMIHCQRDYSLQWHFCKRVDSPSFRFCSVSTKRLHCLEQKELLFPSVSFIEENSASKL